MFGQILTGKDLYNAMIKILGANSVTEDNVANWLNIAIGEYPKEAFSTVRTTYNDVLANVEYDLPLDFASLEGLSIYDSTTGGRSDYSKASSVKVTRTDGIIFPEALTTVDLEYSPVQGPYDDLNQELPLRRSLRPILYHYLMSEYYTKEGEGSIEEERVATRYLQRYERLKAIALADLEQRDLGGPVSTSDVMPKREYRRSINATFEEYDGNGDVE